MSLNAEKIAGSRPNKTVLADYALLPTDDFERKSCLARRLQAAFQRERQFSSDLAHEMKTAIAILKSTLQSTLVHGGGVAAYRLGVERALEDTERMQSLVAGMLQLAKIEGLDISTLERAPAIDALEQIEIAIRRLTPLLEARCIRIAVDSPEPTVPVRLSPENFSLVLTNLFENAIHYSSDRDTIQAIVEVRSATSILKIRDRGCGIDMATLPHIFERFYRGDVSRSRKNGGAGLGLAIVQAIVQRAGGTVTVDSSPGVGSTFTLMFPH